MTLVRTASARAVSRAGERTGLHVILLQRTRIQNLTGHRLGKHRLLAWSWALLVWRMVCERLRALAEYSARAGLNGSHSVHGLSFRHHLTSAVH
jgi:hypothetical protein